MTYEIHSSGSSAPICVAGFSEGGHRRFIERRFGARLDIGVVADNWLSRREIVVAVTDSEILFCSHPYTLGSRCCNDTAKSTPSEALTPPHTHLYSFGATQRAKILTRAQWMRIVHHCRQ